MIKTCQYCRKEFETKDKNQIYCSRECFKQTQRKTTPIVCNYCGKEFYLRPSKISRGERHFCNLECRKKYFDEFGTYKHKKSTRCKNEFFNEIVIENNYAKIIISSNKYGIKECLIDTNKIDIVKNIFWHVAKIYEGYFAVIGYDKQIGKEVKIHRYLTNCPANKVVDHINRNPLDNRLENLRCVSIGDNVRNSKVLKNSISGVKGVRYRYGRYQARITINGKTISLGHFDTLEEAKNARVEFCKKHNIIS